MEELLKSSATWITIISGTICPFIFKFVIKPIWRHFKSVKEMQRTVLETSKMTKRVFKEFESNGGTSLKDSVSELKNSMGEVKCLVQGLQGRQRASLEYSDRYLFEMSKNGEIVWANRKFLYLLGASFEDVKGFNWRNFIHVKDEAPVMSSLRVAVDQDTDFRAEFTIVDSEENDIKVKMEVRRVPGERGEVLSRFGAIGLIGEELD